MMNVLNYQIVQVRVIMGPEQSYDTLHTELLLILRVFMQFNPYVGTLINLYGNRFRETWHESQIKIMIRPRHF